MAIQNKIPSPYSPLTFGDEIKVSAQEQYLKDCTVFSLRLALALERADPHCLCEEGALHGTMFQFVIRKKNKDYRVRIIDSSLEITDEAQPPSSHSFSDYEDALTFLRSLP